MRCWQAAQGRGRARRFGDSRAISGRSAILALWAAVVAALIATPAGAQGVTAPAAVQALAAPGMATGEDRARAIQCMATAIAYEAGYEPLEGQQAVAEVILNRARSGAFAKTVCGVVFTGSERRTGCQFSFTCDGSMRRRLPEAVMRGARAVAEAAIDGLNPARVSGAAWYHADYVSPYWAPSLVRVTKIGAHIFYRAPGLGDRPRGLTPFLPSGEPTIAAMAGLPGVNAGAGAAAPATAPAAEKPAPFSLWGLMPVRR